MVPADATARRRSGSVEKGEAEARGAPYEDMGIEGEIRGAR
jgi:hypothetical protein